MLKWNIDRSWTLFLDRDGVINERIMGGYVCQVDDFHFIDHVPETIASLSHLFGHIVVVTNQQGIGKGLMTESNLEEIHSYMCTEVEREGGQISAVYFAPDLHGPDNMLRKPLPGMALQAKKDVPEIDFERSVMVGDSDSDMIFGKNLGMKTVRIRTVEPVGTDSDLEFESLKEFKEWLIQ